jgi:hypothetical protein
MEGDYTQLFLVSVPLFVVPLASLLITTTPLPVYRTNWVNKVFSYFRAFKLSDAEEGNRIAKENQFLKGAGQLNFNWVAIVYVVIPCGVINFFGWSYEAFNLFAFTTAERWFYVALMFGWAGAIGLSFFFDSSNSP